MTDIAQHPSTPNQVSEYSAEQLLQARLPSAHDPDNESRIRTRWLLDAACARLRRQGEQLLEAVKTRGPRDLTGIESTRSYLDLACERLEWIQSHDFADRARERIRAGLAKIRQNPQRVYLGPIREMPEDWHQEWRWVYDEAELERALAEATPARPGRHGRSQLPPSLSEEQLEWLHTQRAQEESAMLRELCDWLARLARDVWPSTPPHPDQDTSELPGLWGGPWITHQRAVNILRYVSKQTGQLASGGALRRAIKRAPDNNPLAWLRDTTQRVAKDPDSGLLRYQAVVAVARALDIEPDLTA